MKKMTQFKAIVAMLLNETSGFATYYNMKFQNAATFNYVSFFSNQTVRNMIIPEFDHVNMMLQCGPVGKTPTTYDNKFMQYLRDSSVAPTDCALDRDFWACYVRDLIHDFVRKTWSAAECEGGMYITRADAEQILGISHRVRHYGPKDLATWEDMINHDYMHRYEQVYSGLFDVKMNYNSEVGDGHVRPVYLYSYGPKAWANCMSFLLRMHWNNLCAQTI